MAGLDRTGKTQPTGRASRFSEILKLKNAEQEEALPEMVSLRLENASTTSTEVVATSPSPASAAIPAPVEVETKAKVGRRGKVSKRSNPDYMQAIFHLPVKTSKRLDRELLDLGEAGINLDRSELAEELFQSFFRLSEQVGTTEALKQFRSLRSQ